MAWTSTLLKATSEEVIVELRAADGESDTSAIITRAQIASLLVAGEGGRVVPTQDDIYINWVEATGRCSVTVGKGTSNNDCVWSLNLTTTGLSNTDQPVWTFLGNTGKIRGILGAGTKPKRRSRVRKNKIDTKRKYSQKRIPLARSKTGTGSNGYHATNFLKLTDCRGYSSISGGAVILVSLKIERG